MHPSTRPATRLFGLKTAVPAHTGTQAQSHNFMTRVIEETAGAEEVDRALLYLDGIKEGCGISRRYTVIEDFKRSDPREFTFFPPNWRLDPFPTTAQRMQVYEPQSVALAERACRAALTQSGFAAEEVTHLIVTTCTGLYAPGPDILLVKNLGLRPSTRRTVIGFMGCYAAFNGLRMADQIVRAEPDAVVLQVCVELCTLHFQNALEPQTIIGNCLFADGCGAAVYASRDRDDKRARPRGLADVATSHCFISHDSLDQMQWHIGDHGFTMYLDVEIPDTLRANGAKFLNALCDMGHVQPHEVPQWAVHPGGPKIIDAVRDAGELAEDQVRVSRSVLRDYGNMSSATILFVLERKLRGMPTAVPIVAVGFGPGLTMEGAVLVPPC